MPVNAAHICWLHVENETVNSTGFRIVLYHSVLSFILSFSPSAIRSADLIWFNVFRLGTVTSTKRPKSRYANRQKKSERATKRSIGWQWMFMFVLDLGAPLYSLISRRIDINQQTTRKCIFSVRACLFVCVRADAERALNEILKKRKTNVRDRYLLISFDSAQLPFHFTSNQFYVFNTPDSIRNETRYSHFFFLFCCLRNNSTKLHNWSAQKIDYHFEMVN